jgi:hypothetical protein
MNKFKKVINKRNLWTLIEGKSIGFIEAKYRKGFFIQADYITYCETSSNITSNYSTQISIGNLPLEKKNMINNIMNKKKLVSIDFSGKLFGSPFKGDFFFQVMLMILLSWMKKY